MAYEIIWESRGVLFRLSGDVIDADLLDANEEVYAHPKFAEMRYQIVDFSVITHFGISADAVARAAKLDQQASLRNPDVKVAIITSEPLLRGLSSLYSRSHTALGGAWRTKTFDTEAEAREWAEAED